MNIQLLETYVDELSLLKIDDTEKIEKMQFSVGQAFSTTNLKEFVIVFDVKIKVGEERLLQIKYISKFESDQSINEDERGSKFFSINAPAIGYPFLRAYISNIMLSSGYDPIIMPTINFVKLNDNNSEELEHNQ